MTTHTQSGSVVAVTGATGFIGRAIVAKLAESGHRVRALARDLGKASEVLPVDDSVEVVVGDVFSEGSLDELCEGATALIHLVGIRKEDLPEVSFQHMHVDGTQRAIEAAKRAGVDRFVQMSSLGTRPAARSAYHQTKFVAEEMVRGSGLDWTIIRPSVVIGPDGGFLEMAKGWARGESAPRLFMPYFEPPTAHAKESLPADISSTPRIQPVDRDDVAAAFVAAVEREAAIGEVYPLGGPEVYEWPDLLAAVRDDMGLKKPVWGVPSVVGEAVACAASLVRCDSLLPFSRSEVQMSCEANVCANAKVEAELGVTARAISFAG